MRPTLIASLFALVAVSAQAEGIPAPVPSCVAVGGGYTRVVATVAQPQDCCTGRLRCAQFLSTTTVVRPAHDPRT